MSNKKENEKAEKKKNLKALHTQETIKNVETEFFKIFEKFQRIKPFKERIKAEKKNKELESEGRPTLQIEKIKEFESKKIPTLQIGDNVKVGVKIVEGERERVQLYEGTIISKKNSSINTTITVRKTLQGIGIERIFLIYSPKIESINVLRSSKVRRSKLYYLRNLKGKASRLKQTFK